MSWYKWIMLVVAVLASFTAFIMGACAHAAEQHGNTLASFSMLACVGLLMVITFGLMREVCDE